MYTTNFQGYSDNQHTLFMDRKTKTKKIENGCEKYSF